MELVLAPEALLLAIIIFVLRVINSAVGTVRLVVMARGRVWLTAVLGFIEALIFAYVTANVVTDLSNILNLVAYCGGFSLGIYVGMAVEQRFVVSYIRLNIISPHNGHDMAVVMREMGHGVTEVQGAGGSGEVTMITSVILRRDVPEVLKAVYAIHPDAFVTMEDARAVQHGWMRPFKHQR